MAGRCWSLASATIFSDHRSSKTSLRLLLSIHGGEVSSAPGILMVSLPPLSKLKRRVGLLVRPSDDMSNPSGTTTRTEDAAVSSIIKPRHGEDSYAIGRFILDRAQALGLSRTDLVRRFRYTGIGRGHRALTDLLIGGLMSPLIADNLAAALEVEQQVIDPIIQTDPLKETGPRAHLKALHPIPLPIVFTENQLVLHEMTVENGFYKWDMYSSFVDADYTGTDRAVKILGGDFVDYLSRYFDGWQLLQRVQVYPYPNRVHVYKIVYYVLSFDTDADAATVASHLNKTTYPFDFRYRRVLSKP
jgi:hypothetical protein